MRFLLRSKNGFTIVEILIACVIFAGVAVGGASVFSSANKMKKKTEASSALTRMKSVLISNLRSSESLAATALHNTGADCLKTLNNCPMNNSAWAKLAVYDNNSQPLTDPNLPNWGFGADSLPCSSFPSEACPFQYEVQWSAYCTSPELCMVPQIKAAGKLTVAEQFKVPINPDQFAFNITLGKVVGTYEQVCTSVGGTYTPGEPPQCNYPMLGNCPPLADGTPQFVTAYDKTTGLKQCSPPFSRGLASTCPGGTVMIGVMADGNPDCRTVKPNPGCADLSDPACQPMPCQANPMDPACQPIPADVGSAGGGGDGGGDGGCDGGC